MSHRTRMGGRKAADAARRTMLDLERLESRILLSSMPGITERVSLAWDGAEGNDRSQGPFMSTDGRYVAFYSGASNLVPGDTNDTWDVFVHMQSCLIFPILCGSCSR